MDHEIGRRRHAHRLGEHRAHIRGLCHGEVAFGRSSRADFWNRRLHPPGDGIRVVRSPQHIQIAITIHVRCVHGKNAVEKSLYCMLGPRSSISRRILEPRHVVGISGPADHIDIPVAIHICRIHGLRTVETPGDRVLGPRASIPCRILPPRHIVDIEPPAQHIQVAVPIHIRRVYSNGPIEVGIDRMFGPRSSVSRRILEPRHVVEIVRRGQDIQIAIPVHIRRIHRIHPVEIHIHRMSRPGTPVSRRILEPRHVVGIVRRTQQIQIAITIHIRRIHRMRAVEAAIHCVLCPRTPIPRRVLPPRDIIGNRCRAQHIQIAVAVHIG